MRRDRRGVAAVAVVGLVALVLAGCGTGRDAPTSRDLPSVPGVNIGADDGSVLVRNASVVFSLDGYPTGEQAPVELWLVNTTAEPIRLVEVTAGQATSVTFDDLTLAPSSAVPATLAATGLRQRIDFSQPLTLTLTFDNGAEISAVVPMAPPMDHHPPRASR
jgi:hypothetical protein